MEAIQIHIGHQITLKLQEKKISVAQFAVMLNTDKSNMYKILHKPHIDTDLLFRISKLLNYNFFNDFCSAVDTPERKYLAILKLTSEELSTLEAFNPIGLIEL